MKRRAGRNRPATTKGPLRIVNVRTGELVEVPNRAATAAAYRALDPDSDRLERNRYERWRWNR